MNDNSSFNDAILNLMIAIQKNNELIKENVELKKEIQNIRKDGKHETEKK